MNYSIFFFATFFCFLLYRNRMRLIQYCMRNVCLNQDYTHVFSLRATTISNDNSFVVVKKIVANLPVHISYFLNIKNRYRFSCIQRERVNGKREREFIRIITRFRFIRKWLSLRNMRSQPFSFKHSFHASFCFRCVCLLLLMVSLHLFLRC